MKKRVGGPSEAITSKMRETAGRHLAVLHAENEELRALLERERASQLRLQGELAALLARSE